MGQPIRGMTRPLPVKASIIPAVIPPEVVTIDANFNASIHNRFDIEVIDTRTGKVRQHAQGTNVICNQLWTDMLQQVSTGSYIAYGSGTGTPAATDTALFSKISQVAPTGVAWTFDYPNCVASRRRQIQLSETVSVGATITEIGLVDSNSKLTTHAMLKDANGNQISISKTDTDIINIYATVFAHWSSNLYSGEIVFSTPQNAAAGQPSYFFQWLLSGGGALPGSIGAGYGRRTNQVATTARATTTLNTAQKQVTFTFNRLAASIGNLPNGIRTLSVREASYGGLIFTITCGGTMFPPTTVIGESIGTGDGVTCDFATAFDSPTNAKIYVNGVEDTSAIVDAVPLKASSMANYFEAVFFQNGVAYPSTDNEFGSDYGTTYFGYDCIYYNPYYQYGLKTTSGYLKASNDGQTWVTISKGTIPAEYRNYKYWANADPTTRTSIILTADQLTGKNIHFSTLPASGAVITGDYTTPTIPKDANHVLDLSLTITLGEYAG